MQRTGMDERDGGGNRGGPASTAGVVGSAKRLPKLFPRAAQPDIIRATQKDELYLTYFTDSCHDAVRRLLGPRRALLYSRETRCAAELLYYALTTGAGVQTLGEEYCDILQIAGPAGTEPGLLRRGVLVLLQALGPYFAQQLAAQNGGNGEDSAVSPEMQPLRWQLASGLSRVGERLFGERLAGGSLEGAQSRLWERAREAAAQLAARCRRAMVIARPYVPAAVRLHLALFYFFGIYYHWAKRLTGVRYTFIGKLFERRPSYHLLGVLLFAQLAASAGAWALAGLDAVPLRPGSSMPSMAARGRGGTAPGPAVVLQDDGEVAGPGHALEPGGSDDSAAAALGKCPLCLGVRDAPTATPCGHVFCWACIAAWHVQKPECPLCRSPFTTAGLVCIYV